MHLISWNINGAFQPPSDATGRIVEAFQAAEPELVTLQGVHRSQAGELAQALKGIGLGGAAASAARFPAFSPVAALNEPEDGCDHPWSAPLRAALHRGIEAGCDDERIAKVKALNVGRLDELRAIPPAERSVADDARADTVLL